MPTFVKLKGGGTRCVFARLDVERDFFPRCSETAAEAQI